MDQAEITREMWDLYQSGISMPEIGRRYGCSKNAVSHRFRRAGLSGRAIEADPVLVQRALEMYESGKSVAAIARELGRHPKNVGSWLHRRGIETSNRDAVHRLSEIDQQTRMAVCSECGPVKVYQTGPGKTKCSRWILQRRRERPWENGKPHLFYRTNTCGRCGLFHEDKRVFDVHHKDHDHSNNDPENLETLCPTCHRLEHLGIGGGK